MRENVKRRLNLRLLSKRKVKGIIVSTEMILLLTAIIMFAVVAFFGISRTILQQATNEKATLVVVRAEAWKIQNGIAVSLYLQNTGSQTVTINGIGVKYGYGTSVYNCYIGIPAVYIRPGEAKVVSGVLGYGPGISYNYQCSYTRYVGVNSNVYVYVRAGSNEVGTAVKVKAP